ncbi:UNVERIFIED_ORG: hypothetical protein J2X79_003762 [Arthrobacter globiformis]|nr:hypothetical protein [Arthrobacter globiformis]
MTNEVALVRKEAAAAALRAGRHALDHQRRLAAIASVESIAKAEINAAVSIIDAAAAQPQNATVRWLLNRYFRD